MSQPSFIQIRVDESGIAMLMMAMEGKVNKINAEFILGLEAAVDEVAARSDVKGIILASAHKDFCVGADIDMLYQTRDPALILEGSRRLSAVYRKLETCGKPSVAALTGSALGGGYELALACHRRIALNNPRIQVGLPEVGLGVLPGAGGTQRLPRMIGVQAALEYLAQGKMVRAPSALKSGLVDDLAETPEDLQAKASAWILANLNNKQPWDRGKMKWPPPDPNSNDGRALFVGACAFLYKKTAGAFPAPEAIVDVVREGSQLSFDRALEVEARAFAKLAVSDTAKDMIRTFWYHRNAVERCEGLTVAEQSGFQKVAILGAGMMGAGLAYICAEKGREVVLKDISAEVLEKAQAHCKQEVAKKRHLKPEDQKAILDRITYTMDAAPLQGCDLVIEAVVENMSVKHAVTRELLPLLSPEGVWASNTSALPITRLAEASDKPEKFIGLHFFSPVEQMPLLEIIVGASTDEETLARSVRFARDLGKLPIVVNDGYGFFTSRVFSAYLMEGVQMVCEGHDPALVEWAARVQGMVVSPLKVFDEVSLKLGQHAFEQAKSFRDSEDLNLEGVELIRKMVAQGRYGKAHGAGFYDYSGKRQLWPGLKALVGDRKPGVTGVDYIGRRLILAQIAQVARCLEEGILRSYKDAEVGAIFGIGFAPNTGGPLSWIDRQGVANVVAELETLSKTAGRRFEPAPVLKRMAERGERFFSAV